MMKMVKSLIITLLWITKFFFTNIVAYKVLHGHVSFFFKDEHFYKFITLQFLAYKKNRL